MPAHIDSGNALIFTVIKQQMTAKIFEQNILNLSNNIYCFEGGFIFFRKINFFSQDVGCRAPPAPAALVMPPPPPPPGGGHGQPAGRQPGGTRQGGGENILSKQRLFSYNIKPCFPSPVFRLREHGRLPLHRPPRGGEGDMGVRQLPSN